MNIFHTFTMYFSEAIKLIMVISVGKKPNTKMMMQNQRAIKKYTNKPNVNTNNTESIPHFSQPRNSSKIAQNL